MPNISEKSKRQLNRANVSSQENSNFFGVESRYANHRFVIMKINNRILRTIETWEKPQIPEEILDGNGIKYLYVGNKESFRPDLVSIKSTGNRFYWWWVFFSNGILDLEQLKPGITISSLRPPTERPLRPRFGPTRNG